MNDADKLKLMLFCGVVLVVPVSLCLGRLFSWIKDWHSKEREIWREFAQLERALDKKREQNEK